MIAVSQRQLDQYAWYKLFGIWTTTKQNRTYIKLKDLSKYYITTFGTVLRHQHCQLSLVLSTQKVTWEGIQSIRQAYGAKNKLFLSLFARRTHQKLFLSWTLPDGGFRWDALPSVQRRWGRAKAKRPARYGEQDFHVAVLTCAEGDSKAGGIWCHPFLHVVADTAQSLTQKKINIDKHMVNT